MRRKIKKVLHVEQHAEQETRKQRAEVRAVHNVQWTLVLHGPKRSVDAGDK